MYMYIIIIIKQVILKPQLSLTPLSSTKEWLTQYQALDLQ